MHAAPRQGTLMWHPFWRVAKWVVPSSIWNVRFQILTFARTSGDFKVVVFYLLQLLTKTENVARPLTPSLSKTPLHNHNHRRTAQPNKFSRCLRKWSIWKQSLERHIKPKESKTDPQSPRWNFLYSWLSSQVDFSPYWVSTRPLSCKHTGWLENAPPPRLKIN